MSFGIASAISETAKIAVSEVPNEVGNKMKDFLPDFFKNLKPETSTMEQADQPIVRFESQNLSTDSDSEIFEGTEPQNENTVHIPCRNESLAGQEHPETNVKFEQKYIEVDGITKEVVVPEFDSLFDAQLPDDQIEASDKEQFAECNNQLKEAIENDPELKGKFTDEQIEQIENGDTPDGCTWHHDAEFGKMQLVDSEVHAKTGHTGGKVIWGGGSENR